MSKLQRLRDNIAAIECALKGENNQEVLSKYSGFGGLAFVLNSENPAEWSKSDLDCYADTMRLFALLHTYSKDEMQFDAWYQSLKASTLTAYYTPGEIVDVLFLLLS